MNEAELRRVFRAIVLGISAPAVAGGSWVGCGPSTIAPDAGDATAFHDASDGGTIFPDVAIDSYVAWCEAGPPQRLTGDSCVTYLYVPCGLPTGDYVVDDAGTIFRCDQICHGYNTFQCTVLDNADIALLLAGLDAGVQDAADDATASQPDAAVYVACDCYFGGRRPAGLRRAKTPTRGVLATYFAQMAHLEAASVPAFRRMLAELRALRAPSALLDKVERAIREEQRHAKVMGRIARRFGGVMARPRVRPFRLRGIEAMARENAVEGCVRETYGALVATWQAVHAMDPMIRQTMSGIAADETRHAALSWEAARFYATRLDAPARVRVASAMSRARRELHEAMQQEPHEELIVHAGLPSAANARRLIDAMTVI